eukprot:jgi/Astpho2/8465/Aster-08364
MDDETLQMLTSEEWEYKLEQPAELSGFQAQPACGMEHLVVPANAIAMSMEGLQPVEGPGSEAMASQGLSMQLPSLSGLPSLSNSQKRLVACLPPVVSVSDEEQPSEQGSIPSSGMATWGSLPTSKSHWGSPAAQAMHFDDQSGEAASQAVSQGTAGPAPSQGAGPVSSVGGAPVQVAEPARTSSNSSQSQDEILKGALGDTQARVLRKAEQNKRAQQRHRQKQKMKQQEQQQEIASLRSQLQEALRLKQVASSRSATLEKAMVVNGSREPQIPDSSVCTEMIEYSRDAPFSPNAVVTIRTLGQEKRQFLISDMMRMSVAQHRQTYKAFINRFASMLADAGGDDRSPVVEDITEAMNECGNWGAAAMTVCGKQNIRQLLCEKLEDVPQETPPMTSLVAHLRLTRDQQLQIIECFKHYKKATEPLVAKRTMICATLGKLSEQKVHSSEAAAVGFGTAAKGAALLNEVLTQEMMAWQKLQSTMFRKCLTPFQLAEATVLAYPMTLDLVVLADAVAVLHGAESSALLSGFQSIGSQAISSHARIAELAL